MIDGHFQKDEIAYNYRKTRYSSRRKGLIITALRALGLIEYAMLDGWKKNAFLCRECNMVHEKRSILVHYGSSNRHEEVYRIVLALLDAWALDPKEPSGTIEGLSKEILKPEIRQVSLNRKFTCSCGMAFNSNGSLYRHRKGTGHPTIRMRTIAAPGVDRKKTEREVIKN